MQIKSTYDLPKIGLIEYLQNKHIRSLIITGLQTDYCIDATVKSAFENGFEVIVPAGCNSTCDNAYMDAETTYKFYNESMWQRIRKARFTLAGPD